MKPSIIIAILSLLICSHITNAQEPAGSPKSPDTERRQKAVALLESLATQVTSLQSPENRARIGANIADSLWKYNENRARAMFIGIEDDIKLGFQDRDISDAADGHTILVFHKLRSDTVQRIAKYDAEFALNFLYATAPPPEVGLIIPGNAESTLELQLAKQLTISNPEIALKLGRQSLAHGFSSDLLTVLRQLHRKHRDKGVTLYKEVVQKLRDADLAEDYEALNFARSLAQAITPPAADESAFRDLINALITSALENECDKTSKTEESRYCFEIAALITTMEKIDPVRTRKLKHLTANRENWAGMELAYTELQEVAADGTVDEVLALANKYPQIQTLIYSQAMLDAAASGDFERAKTIANSHSNPEERRMLLGQIESMKAQAEVTEQEVAEFQTLLDSVPNDRARLTLLDELTDRVGTKNRTMALKLIDQTATIVDRIKSPAEKTSARLNLAMSYCAQGSDRGLEIAESEIPKLNELIAAATKLNGFDTQYLRDGEWNMSANGSVGSILTFLAQNAGSFAACDFDRAVNLAGQFERGEIRMMAQTKLAQSILSGPPMRSRPPSRRYVGFSVIH